jgi:hypothetical protein
MMFYFVTQKALAPPLSLPILPMFQDISLGRFLIAVKLERCLEARETGNGRPT